MSFDSNPIDNKIITCEDENSMYSQLDNQTESNGQELKDNIKNDENSISPQFDNQTESNGKEPKDNIKNDENSISPQFDNQTESNGKEPKDNIKHDENSISSQIDKKSKDNIKHNEKFNASQWNKKSKIHTKHKDTKTNTPQLTTRFPPEPSGMLHIGHAKALLINTRHASQTNGNLIIRFDDTNPVKETQHFVDSIRTDITDLLSITPQKWSYTSDYFPYIIEFTYSLIKRGLAYLDDTSVDEMKRQRFIGEKSKSRDNATITNIYLFRKFVCGDLVSFCVRAKIVYDDDNKAMRDPVIFRYVGKKHHRNDELGYTISNKVDVENYVNRGGGLEKSGGREVCVYPTYDLACPIVDCLEGVTHAFRTNEYRDRNKVYEWIVKNTWNNKEIRDEVLSKFGNSVVYNEIESNMENLKITNEEESCDNKNEIIMNYGVNGYISIFAESCDNKNEKIINCGVNGYKKIFVDSCYKGPKINDFGRLSFENTLLSKRKLTTIINENNLTWEDPRIPTLRGLKNRGMCMDVLIKYINNTGMKQKCVVASWDKVWAENRKFLDAVAERLYGIPEDEAIECFIENWNEVYEHYKNNNKNEEISNDSKYKNNLEEDFFVINIDKNKKKIEMGKREIKVSNTLLIPNEGLIKDSEITLMNLGNFIIKDIKNNKIILRFNKNGSYKDTSIKLQWVSMKYNKKVNVSEYFDLCIKGTETFNKESKIDSVYFVEEAIENISSGNYVQIERIAFCVYNNNNLGIVPFTRQPRKK